MRFAIVLLGGLGLALAAPGVVADSLFAQPTFTKYVVTVLAPLLLVCIGLTRSPLKLCVGLAIVAAPLAPDTATLGGVSVPLGAVILGTAVVVAVLLSPLGGSLSSVGRTVVVALALVAEPVLAGANVNYSLVWIGALLITGWLVSLICRQAGGARFVAGAIVVSAAIQAAVAIYEYKTGHEINLYGGAGSESFGSAYFFTFGNVNRPVGLFTDPNSLGNVLALALPMVIYLAATARSRLQMCVTALVGLLILAGLTLSLSRMSWIGGIAGSSLMLAMLPPRVRWRATSTTVALVLVVGLIGSAALGSSFTSRAESIFSPTSGQNSHSIANPGEDVGRARLWGAALDIFVDDPLFGVGANRIDPLLAQRTGGITQYSQAQSTFFQVLAEMGICGGLALIALLAAVIRAVIRGFSFDRPLVAAVAGSMVSVLLAWTTDYTVHEVTVGMFVAAIFGIAAGLANRAGSPTVEVRRKSRSVV